MATLKFKEIAKMNEEDRDKKLKELKMELIKSRANNSKSIKTREIKRVIARLLTLNK